MYSSGWVGPRSGGDGIARTIREKNPNLAIVEAQQLGAGVAEAFQGQNQPLRRVALYGVMVGQVFEGDELKRTSEMGSPDVVLGKWSEAFVLQLVPSRAVERMLK